MFEDFKLIMPLDVFPSVNWFHHVIGSGASKVGIDVGSKWTKQTARTRYKIAGPNKRLQLVLPVNKQTRGRWSEVELNFSENWPILHWKSLESAYNRSPYFEFYRDELKEIVTNPPRRLSDHNMQSIRWLSEKLQLSVEFIETEFAGSFEDSGGMKTTYPQVFEDRLGFLPNLSALDLLFNLGPEARSVLT